MRPGPDLRIWPLILIITGINQYSHSTVRNIYSCAHISMTDAGFRWYHWHQTMPDDGGPSAFRNVSLAQPIIKSQGQVFLRGRGLPIHVDSFRFPLFWPSVSIIDRIAPDFSKETPTSSTPVADLLWRATEGF